jgi:hypothetical protein
MDGDLRKLFSRNLPMAQWTPIETGTTAQGVPDSEYCFPGGLQGHVEHKRTLGWQVGMRPEQVGWISRRARLGGRVFIAVRQLGTQRGISSKRDVLWLFHGLDAAKLSLEGLRGADPLLEMPGGPGRWDWGTVRIVLEDRSERARSSLVRVKG